MGRICTWKFSDPAQTRELFHFLKAAAVSKYRSPCTLENKVAGKPLEARKGE